ncbi:hypothetical protein P691DRAFT_727240 [Macrolepiota fuliginosa MF-IS2]|uniref:Transcription factor IIIC 90kDa subunit N-terminal domain-containing protein n=1 Tax=Macrolepiota fuliginosa MF-IS2 TaxID=1400762 RepID=A0A9P6C5J6_9AGAR|nr:hypothetical protein P691DRAFT_727240 [Macrolepiota fuliginosa MF-IS2]
MTTSIYATLNFPTATSHPCLTCLQWSTEGQLCFASKNAAYILTPEYGVTHDNASAIKSSSKKDNASDQSVVGRGWFRTIVQFDLGEGCKWPEYSQGIIDWGAVSLGSIDLNLWAIVISPSNLSSTAGCVIATLSSNLDLSLWTATRNPLKGEWVKVFDVTPYLLERFQTTLPDQGQTAQTLRAQVVSICWSPQPDFGIAPVPGCNGSLLIAGNRGGGILFLRFARDSLELVHDLPLSDQWISNMAFSAWTSLEPGKTSGVLAYGTSGGAVGLVEITQILVEKEELSLFGPECTVQTTVRDLGLIHQLDKAGVTSMGWVIPRTSPPVLIFSKPGKLLFWSASSDGSRWPGIRTLILKTQKLHKSSSALHPVTGFNYVPHKDILIVTLSDGSFHAVQYFSSNPSWSEDDITSQQLSKAARSVFIETRGGNVDSVDMNRITGSTSFDGASTIAWTQEAMRPSDFSYKHEAKHSSSLIVAQLWEDEENSDDLLLERLQHLLDTVKASSGQGPLGILRPYLFRLNNKTKLNKHHAQILQVLRVSHEEQFLTINIPPCTTSLSDEVKRRFRGSLSRHLFGHDALASLRIRLALADFTWKLSDIGENQRACGLIARGILNAISHSSLHTIIKHLDAILDLLQPDDIPFVLRTVMQSLLPGSPPYLSAEAQALSQRVQARIPIQHSKTGDPTHEAVERCPACGVVVQLQDITVANCANGHRWPRCSITTFILSTPSVRTCIGCSRKAFLPLSSRTSPEQLNWLPQLARGWVVEELLEAVQRCLFCNNSFVRVL